jgi:hypothetical protein
MLICQVEFFLFFLKRLFVIFSILIMVTRFMNFETLIYSLCQVNFPILKNVNNFCSCLNFPPINIVHMQSRNLVICVLISRLSFKSIFLKKFFKFSMKNFHIIFAEKNSFSVVNETKSKKYYTNAQATFN